MTTRIKIEDIRPGLLIRERATGRVRRVQTVLGEGRAMRVELYAMERAPGCPATTMPTAATVLGDYDHAIPEPPAPPVSETRVRADVDAMTEGTAQALLATLGRVAAALETIAAAGSKGRTLHLFDNVRTA